MFTLVTTNGDPVEDANQEGLLLYYGNTVCDDAFNDDSADAICREMGYPGATSWRYGEFLSIQSVLAVGLDNVVCTSDSWESCSYITDHNCGHDEDVHLTCGG